LFTYTILNLFTYYSESNRITALPENILLLRLIRDFSREYKHPFSLQIIWSSKYSWSGLKERLEDDTYDFDFKHEVIMLNIHMRDEGIDDKMIDNEADEVIDEAVDDTTIDTEEDDVFSETIDDTEEDEVFSESFDDNEEGEIFSEDIDEDEVFSEAIYIDTDIIPHTRSNKCNQQTSYFLSMIITKKTPS
jgi:hypothetical protein